MSDELKKTRPSDGSDTAEEENENNEKKNINADEEYKKEIEELEKERKEHEERRKAELERMRNEHDKNKKDDNENEEDEDSNGQENKKMASGQKIAGDNKVFTRRTNIFRHNRLYNFSGSGTKKIDKILKKAHINTQKRKDLLKTLAAYNPSNSVLKKKDFEMFARKFKGRSFTGNKFKQAAEEIDLKEMRSKFSKRDLNKFRLSVTGEKDPHKYQTKASPSKIRRPEKGKPSKH